MNYNILNEYLLKQVKEQGVVDIIHNYYARVKMVKVLEELENYHKSKDIKYRYIPLNGSLNILNNRKSRMSIIFNSLSGDSVKVVDYSQESWYVESMEYSRFGNAIFDF